jgi:hypothetical protein
VFGPKLAEDFSLVEQHCRKTHKNQCRAAIAAPIVGENGIGMRFAWRSFQSATRRSASAMI